MSTTDKPKTNIQKLVPDLVDDKTGMPDWRRIYDHMPVENMPWFNPKLDPDLARALDAQKISGGRFLDLGAGPGTQAVELARLGFEVTGSDIAKTAIEQARKRAEGTNAQFVVDDILATSLNQRFDYVFDRGCFHCFEPADHAAYLASLEKLLAPAGTFFLKCFSTDEPGTSGPRRYRETDLTRIFSAYEIRSVEKTVYHGTVGGGSPLDHQPKSLFVTMRRK